MKKEYFNASIHPLEDIAKVSYKGQPEKRRQYRPGYESFFNDLPKIDPLGNTVQQDLSETQSVLKDLASELQKDTWFVENEPGSNDFKRTIIAMESPEVRSVNGMEGDGYIEKEGSELVVASWGDGYTSPVHGHSTGYMHEEVLSGKFKVNVYRMLAFDSEKVRLVRTDIVGVGPFVSQYTPPDGHQHFRRQTLIHNFTSIGNTHSLHYLPEHTRDGRDNGFTPEHFAELHLLTKNEVRQINTQQGLSAQIGDVFLVRSGNVPEYGDHYIVITGHPIVKEHGLRPQDIAIDAPDAYSKRILDSFVPYNGVTLLKLNEELKQAFLDFHDIYFNREESKVIFPKY